LQLFGPLLTGGPGQIAPFASLPPLGGPENGPNKKDNGCSFSIFHNNIVSFNRGNLEKHETHLLEEPDFYFHI
jgi:hypothetical protein